MEYLFILLFMLYLAPWVLAESIEHPNANTILFVTLALGWTGIGWLAAAGWVYRDWPREPTRPQLVLVRPEAIEEPPYRTRTWTGALLALAAVVVVVAGGPAFVMMRSTEVAPEWEIAEVKGSSAQVHLGAGVEWPEVGSIGAPCRVRVLERDGSWLRIWRLEGCAAGMSGRSGWIRMEALRPAPDEAG
ncbi:MAG: superinfection immunity protein [Myxococcota bacterium]